ncbi:streptomycin biosynthesis StrF domain protein [Desulfocucumis palustris]|uniref:Streptomycin biosynthesis StrF domain protein n=1 Tax=Desulfocucumis palustris TaxID=1898651 RepID=A0A2L2XGR6_9FIRM|nr:glycosyltransferase family protein [Desulfocucumis palustris]GBF33416.1 streptomycin biosynthesis StrF domain protein [Desulfocucumis palustris]
MLSVAFITCVNNQQLYQQCLTHLAALDKQGFSVEVVPVQSSVSITNAYNRAMLKSNAKYKVYLHQDTFILEPLFLHHIHRIFSSDPGIGMIGMLGGRNMPLDENKLMWFWDCAEIYGKVFLPSLNQSLGGKPTPNPYEWVTVIDGCLMVTQYDIPWREDIFDGFHYYDLSQSIEFWKRDLKVIVPRQENSWASHICHQKCDSEYYRLRKKFINEYRPYLVKNVKKGSYGFSYNSKKYRFIV